MPEVHFEIIRLEDIGKDVFKSTTSSKHPTSSRPTQKLSNGDVENLKHYLNRYNQAPTKVAAEKKSVHHAFPSSSHANKTSSSSSQPSPNYVDITDDFYSSKHYTEPNEPSEHSQPLIDIYRYHHHYRRHHQHTKQAHERSITAKSIDLATHFALEYATCGMKKNTRLPVPNENFSLVNGCFGDDAGFTMGHHQKNFLGGFTLVRLFGPEPFRLLAGISDGAGGNLMYGFDPRLFSESLMRNCSDLAQTGGYSTAEPKRLLCHAFDRVQTENCFGMFIDRSRFV